MPTFRPTAAILTAAALLLGAGACDTSSEDVGEAIDQAEEGLSEGAGEVADAAEGLASEAGDTADLVGFCDAARRVAGAIEARNAGDALEAAEDLAAEAPEDIASASETVRDAAQRWFDGDESVAEDEEFQSAADEVRTYAEEHCDPRS